jgi:hypothetical protein
MVLAICIVLGFGANWILSLAERVFQPWVRVCINGGDYLVVVSPAAGGRELCLLLLCYYPHLRSLLRAAELLREPRTAAFDDLVLQVTARLLAQPEAAAVDRQGELQFLPERVGLSHQIAPPHCYHIELCKNGRGYTVTNFAPGGPAFSSLFLHYVEMLQAVAGGVSRESRLNLLNSLRDLVAYTRACVDADTNEAMRRRIGHAVDSFHRGREADKSDTHFNTRDVVVSPSLGTWRRAGFYSNGWVRALAITAYPLCYYYVGGPLPDVLALAFALNAGLWTLAGALTAQGIAWFEALTTSVVVGNALWQHGATFRRASTVLLWLALFVFIGAPWHYGRAFALIVAVFIGGTGCEMLGYVLFVRAISKAWFTQLGCDALTRSARPRVPLSPMRLYMTLSNFSVFIPYVIALIVLGALLKLSGANGYLAAASVAIVASGVRFVAPALFKAYARSRVSLFRAILLRKFENERQSNMLRNVVSPALGAYGKLVTLSDTSYEEGREPRIGQQEVADSVKDTFAQVEGVIRNKNQEWKLQVHEAILASDLVVVDVTQMTGSLGWEIAEALTLHDPESVLLICSLEGYTWEKLSLASTILARLDHEWRERGGAQQLGLRFRRVLPPLVYTTYPSSLIFRLRLVGRLAEFLATRRTSASAE